MENYHPEVRKVTKIDADQILEQIKIFGPISCVELERYFEVKKSVIQSHIFRLRKKGNKIKSIYIGKKHHYEFVKTIDTPAQQRSIVDNSEKTKEEKKPKQIKGIDCFVDRCYYLIKALEHCSNNAIMDNFNLSCEEARVLINKVATKYQDISVSFCAHIKKG